MILFNRSAECGISRQRDAIQTQFEQQRARRAIGQGDVSHFPAILRTGQNSGAFKKIEDSPEVRSSPGQVNTSRVSLGSPGNAPQLGSPRSPWQKSVSNSDDPYDEGAARPTRVSCHEPTPWR
jgi:hypothetical protein